MTRVRFHLFAASAALSLSLSLGLGAPPAAAQAIVFDPSNFSQNVLTAARELQQIANQITSLQNQAQMLVNEARNLKSLSYSALQQLQASIQRTQQLLAQAQSQARAQSLQGAQTAAAEDQGREQLQRFLTPGAGYQPTAVTMFH